MAKKARKPERRERNKKVQTTTSTSASTAISQNNTNSNAHWILTTIITTLIYPAIVTAVAYIVGISSTFHDEFEGNRPHFIIRLALSIFLDSTYTHVIYVLLIPLARKLARRLPGAVVPADSAKCARQEHEQHDLSLTWPLPDSDIPPDWVASAANSKKKQPFFLNHVRGSTRCRQATFRIASALGTVLMAIVMSNFVDQALLSDIGLGISLIDLFLGVLVGVGVVVIIFIMEVYLGWLKIVGYGEVIVPDESLSINLLWDVLFHIGVSINEEVSMRGWILVNTARYIASYGVSAYAAMALSVSLQASLFALLHLNSPGASFVGLVNLVIGGIAAALNVFLSGGLSFGIGWHFGWNIIMGHLLGMSTSGIPMSAKLISVVPHPDKAHLHGGKFGPEQSPLAPLAYILGCIMLVKFYGLEGINVWQDRLTSNDK